MTHDLIKQLRDAARTCSGWGVHDGWAPYAAWSDLMDDAADAIEALGGGSQPPLEECPACGGVDTYTSPADCQVCSGNGGPPE